MISFLIGAFYETFIQNKVRYKTLFFIKTSYDVPVRNESISQSKICKKHYFALSLECLDD